MCSLNITVYGLLERYFQKLNCHLIFQIGQSVILNWETSNHLNNNCLTVSIKTSQYGNKKNRFKGVLSAKLQNKQSEDTSNPTRKNLCLKNNI